MPIIIARDFIDEQEEQLIEVLKKNKLATSWTLANIKGIDLTVCMHRITLEDEAKPCHQPQRRLNTTLRES